MSFLIFHLQWSGINLSKEKKKKTRINDITVLPLESKTMLSITFIHTQEIE